MVMLTTYLHSARAGTATNGNAMQYHICKCKGKMFYGREPPEENLPLFV